MEYKHILFDQQERIVTITLNRPERRNSLTDEVHGELMGAIARVAADDSVLVLIMAGAGSDFCVGAEMARGDIPSEDMLDERSPEAIRRLLRHMQPIPRMLHEMEKPTIARVNGAAGGGGMDIALACDIRVGTPSTMFRSFMQTGLTPGMGGLWLMVKLLGYSRACDMFFRAKRMYAEEALQTGILNYIFSEADLGKETMAIAQDIAGQAPIALKLGKILMRESYKVDFNTALEFSSVFQPITMTSVDHQEARDAFLEKRKPHFSGKLDVR